MAEKVFTNFDDEAAALWGKHTIRLRHALHERPLFNDQNLGRLLDRVPASRIAINTMGRKGQDKFEWSYCDRGDLTGEKLIEAVRQGRIWINITKAQEFLPEFAGLLDDMFSEIGGRVPRLAAFKQSIGLLLSSPKAEVYYHADVPGQALWQIRGEKRIYIYPNSSPFLEKRDLENIVRGRTEEEVPYKAWFDKYAEPIDLKPGDMLHWPLNGPHRVENKDCLNISLTTEHWTSDIRKQYAVNYGNGILRAAGFEPRSSGIHGPAAWMKFALTAAWRWSGQQKRQSFKRTMKYRLDSRVPGFLVPIDRSVEMIREAA